MEKYTEEKDVKEQEIERELAKSLPSYKNILSQNSRIPQNRDVKQKLITNFKTLNPINLFQVLENTSEERDATEHRPLCFCLRVHTKFHFLTNLLNGYQGLQEKYSFKLLRDEILTSD